MNDKVKLNFSYAGREESAEGERFLGVVDLGDETAHFAVGEFSPADAERMLGHALGTYLQIHHELGVPFKDSLGGFASASMRGTKFLVEQLAQTKGRMPPTDFDLEYMKDITKFMLQMMSSPDEEE